MTDADFNKIYDDHEAEGKKEGNHIIRIGPEEQYRMKVRLNVHYMPKATVVGEPPCFKKQLRYIYIQQEHGDEQ